MAREIKEATAKYKGLTKKKHAKLHGSSTPGIQKNDNCRADSLKKAILKYPRWYKKDLNLYTEINAQTDRLANRKTLSGGTLK